MKIRTHAVLEEFSAMTPERCQQCDQIFLLKDADPNYDGVVSTIDDNSYCTFSCVTETK
ncbi:hypothetical protein [Acinetobacter sp. CFCC 10889]|uniref:hypothetical protein n=1 Tax=Acinetobacter sp. CFCC 10889 TaxID=1775557 RepID=UPI0013A6CAE2|nr:hypothetical protein [Acinetobacter sp. CFCC 10889]